MRVYFTGMLVGVSVLTVSCTPQRAGFDVRQFQEVASSLQFEQFKMQLARSIDNPYSLPTLTTVGGTSIKSGSSVSLDPSRTLAPVGATDSGSLKLGPFTANTEASVTTTSSPFAILVMRDLYTYAVNGEKNWSPAVESALYAKPPQYRWLYWSTSGRPRECSSINCSSLGRYGKYNLWTSSQKAYSDFVLSVFEASTLSLAAVQTKQPAAAAKPPKGKKTPRKVPISMEPIIERKPQASPDINIITE